MTVKIVALLTVKPGEEERFVAAARACVAGSRAEPGVLTYDLWQEAAGDRRFVFNETYVDEAATAAHRATDHYRAFGSAVRDLLVERPLVIASLPVDVA